MVSWGVRPDSMALGNSNVGECRCDIRILVASVWNISIYWATRYFRMGLDAEMISLQTSQEVIRREFYSICMYMEGHLFDII